MTEARALLIRDNPFFGHLALGLKLACAPCGTACTDGTRLIFDPDFAEKLTDREMMFVILHEVLHCALEHCTRGRGLASELYNIASDIVVNSTILQMWGLDTFTVAGSVPMHLTPDGQEGRLFNSEEVYHMLLRSRMNGKNNPGGAAGTYAAADAAAAPGGSSAQDSAAVPGRSSVQKSVQNGESGTSRYPALDRHDLWRGISDPVRVRAVWNGRIREAAKACGDSSGMPQTVRNLAEKLLHRSKTDWRRLLHDFIQHDSLDYTFLPPDRRFSDSDFFLPAFNIDEENGTVNDIWVCIDTSASVTDKMLIQVVSEILDAMRQAGLNGRISFFDSTITDPVSFHTEEDVKQITPVGGGGTSFRCIFRYMKKYLYPELPKAVLIFTDGFAPCPEEEESMEVPVLWLISGGGRTDLPWGVVAELE